MGLRDMLIRCAPRADKDSLLADGGKAHNAKRVNVSLDSQTERKGGWGGRKVENRVREQ